MTDTIPVISQIKSLLQLLFGQTSQAKETQINFLNGTPVLSQLKSLYELVFDISPIQAFKTQQQFLIITNATISSIPIIGHIKGLGHYLINDTKQGHMAMKRASRTTVVIISAYFACVCFVPTTATLATTMTTSSIGSMIGGISMDTLTTMIENIMDKDGSFNGHYQSFHEMAEEPTDVGKIFDFLVGPLLDGLVGAAVGFKVYQFRNAPIPPPPPHLPVETKNMVIESLPPPPHVPPHISGHIPLPPPHSSGNVPPPLPPPPVPPSIHPLHPLPPPPPPPFGIPLDMHQSRVFMKYGSAAAVVQRHAKYKKQNLLERLIDVID